MLRSCQPSAEFWSTPVNGKLRCIHCKAKIKGNPYPIPIGRGPDNNPIVLEVVTDYLECSKGFLVHFGHILQPDVLSILDEVCRKWYGMKPGEYLVTAGHPSILRRYNPLGITYKEYRAAFKEHVMLILLRPPFLFENADILPPSAMSSIVTATAASVENKITPLFTTEKIMATSESPSTSDVATSPSPSIPPKDESKAGQLKFHELDRQFIVGKSLQITLDVMNEKIYKRQSTPVTITSLTEIWTRPLCGLLRCVNCDAKIYGQPFPVTVRGDSVEPKPISIYNAFTDSLSCSKRYLFICNGVVTHEGLALVERLKLNLYSLGKQMITPSLNIWMLRKFNIWRGMPYKQFRLTGFYPNFRGTSLDDKKSPTSSSLMAINMSYIGLLQFETSSVISRVDPGPIKSSPVHPPEAKTQPRVYQLTGKKKGKEAYSRIIEDQIRAKASVRGDIKLNAAATTTTSTVSKP